jgi:cerevisin
MSVGGLSNKSLNDAVKNAIAQGLHFTVAAGNYNLPASLFSPPNVRAANTIGAVDSKKNFVKWSSSAFGDMIDVWAPGVNIRSAWIGAPDVTNVMSGTSMAT